MHSVNNNWSEIIRINIVNSFSETQWGNLVNDFTTVINGSLRKKVIQIGYSLPPPQSCFFQKTIHLGKLLKEAKIPQKMKKEQDWQVVSFLGRSLVQFIGRGEEEMEEEEEKQPPPQKKKRKNPPPITSRLSLLKRGKRIRQTVNYRETAGD